MQLTPYQKQLASHKDGHVICAAVPGSGKSTTLVYLVSQLLADGVPPQHILVMMFNKDAQLEFDAKLSGLHPNAFLPRVRTYHSMGLNLLGSLEKWGLRAPYNRKPLSEKEVELKIKFLLERMAPAPLQEQIKNNTSEYISFATGFIEGVKSDLATPEFFFQALNLPAEHRYIVDLYEEFEAWRHHERRITFLDMLYDTMTLIEAHPEVIAKIENRVDYLLVDEYQDTSTLQHEMSKVIAGTRANLVAVGDPDQAIYGFCGANLDNILHHFEHDFGKTKPVTTMTLPHSFRYGDTLAMGANSLIHHNKERKDVICISHESNRPTAIQVHETLRESQAIIALIKSYQEAGQPLSDLAVLVRVWAQAVPLELHLLNNHVNYVSSGPNIFERAEIDALVAVLMLVSGEYFGQEPKRKKELLTRLLTLPHLGIKRDLIDHLISKLLSAESGLGNLLGQLADKLNLPDWSLKKVRRRATLLQTFEEQYSEMDAGELLIHYIQETELIDNLESMSLNEQRTREQIMAIEGFVSYVAQLDVNAGNSLNHIRALRSEEHKAGKQNESVTISSVHRAKGLEWPIVIMPGVTDQYWPFERSDELSINSETSTESERRLFYVGITRTISKLHLFTCPQPKGYRKKGEDLPSSFLSELNLKEAFRLGPLCPMSEPESLLTEIKNGGASPHNMRYLHKRHKPLSKELQAARAEHNNKLKERLGSRPKTMPAQTGAWKPWVPGQRIFHSHFGKGLVLTASKSSFTVSFDQHGLKKLAVDEAFLENFSPA